MESEKQIIEKLEETLLKNSNYVTKLQTGLVSNIALLNMCNVLSIR